MHVSTRPGRAALLAAVVLASTVLVAPSAQATQGGPWVGYDGCYFNGSNSNTQHVAQTWESGTNCGGKTVYVRIRYETLNGSIVYTSWSSDATAVVKTVSSTYTILTSYHKMCRTATTACTGAYQLPG